jgi:hypothetical protein
MMVRGVKGMEKQPINIPLIDDHLVLLCLLRELSCSEVQISGERQGIVRGKETMVLSWKGHRETILERKEVMSSGVGNQCPLCGVGHSPPTRPINLKHFFFFR